MSICYQNSCIDSVIEKLSKACKSSSDGSPGYDMDADGSDDDDEENLMKNEIAETDSDECLSYYFTMVESE